MTPERWQEVKRIFDQVLERDVSQQQAYLDGACGDDADLRREVTALLTALADAGSRFEAPALAPDPLIGRQFGAYRLLRRLGMGGMGAVYLGARADDQFRRLAAVKAIRQDLLDDTTRRRFENERHTLAALEHPNIVRLLDGGATEDGIPYLVMDYVEGQPIDRFCKERSLSIPERLALFRTLCAAVHYAHQNLIVHRDLKPANVLVTPQGVPKLLDFGIAKLLRPEYSAGFAGYTRTAAQPMTPEYASPEQILGQPVTTASDVYALGVVLFTLLTGAHPFERQTKSAYELEKAICESEAGKPSDSAPPELARQLRGDLDTIVLAAMRKEPQKRYASAEHFAEDIRRYLDGEPVAAHGDSVVYTASKFVGRHRIAVAGTAIAVALLVALGLSDHANRGRAESRFNDLREFARFAIYDLDPAMRESMTAAREKVASKAETYLDGLAKASSGDDSLQLDVIHGYLKVATLQGNSFVDNLGKQAAARAAADKALAMAQALARRDPNRPDVRAALLACYERLGDIEAPGPAAIPHYRRALDLTSGLEAFSIWTKIARLQEDSDPAAALRSYRGSEQVASEWLAREPAEPKARNAVAFAKEMSGWFGLLAGEPGDAERFVHEAIAMYESNAGPKPSPRARRNIAIAYKRLAEIQKRAGKLPEALVSCRTSLNASQALSAEDPKNVLYGIDIAQEKVLLIDLLLTSGDRAQARTETAAALAYLKPLAQVEAPNPYYLVDYVTILVNTPFPEFSSATETLTYAHKASELMHNSDPETMDLLAKAYQRAGKFDEAIPAELKALSLLPPAKPGPVPEVRRKLEAALRAFQTQAAERQPQRQ